jgi:small subunit ribosomal protein S6
LTTTYEGMFLLDNQAVRADWGRAKGAVTEILAKHGAKVVAARRWDERKLAYPIKGRTRGTYLLAYFEAAPQALNTMRRDFELDERVLRYLLLNTDGVPPAELDLSRAEMAEGFSVPPPPQEESMSPEREVFGELADRPVSEPSRRRGGDRDEPPAEGPDESPDASPEAAPEAVAATEGS